MNILIVDDSKAMRMMVIRSLKQAGFDGHTFLEAVNGKEGLEKIKASPPDLVLSDWNMPEMLGIEMLEELKKINKVPKFGFVTSESTEEMSARAKAAGALFLIVKPFSVEVFQKQLGGIIK